MLGCVPSLAGLGSFVWTDPYHTSGAIVFRPFGAASLFAEGVALSSVMDTRKQFSVVESLRLAETSSS